MNYPLNYTVYTGASCLDQLIESIPNICRFYTRNALVRTMGFLANFFETNISITIGNSDSIEISYCTQCSWGFRQDSQRAVDYLVTQWLRNFCEYSLAELELEDGDEYFEIDYDYEKYFVASEIWIENILYFLRDYVNMSVYELTFEEELLEVPLESLQVTLEIKKINLGVNNDKYTYIFTWCFKVNGDYERVQLPDRDSRLVLIAMKRLFTQIRNQYNKVLHTCQIYHGDEGFDRERAYSLMGFKIIEGSSYMTTDTSYEYLYPEYKYLHDYVMNYDLSTHTFENVNTLSDYIH